MFGLPTGETKFVLIDGSDYSFMLVDYVNPKKEIMQSKFVLDQVKAKGYKNIDAIVYERNGQKTIVSMAEYYAEHGQDLEG